MSIRNPDTERPRTRRELLKYLWFDRDVTDCNIFKEGPYYAVQAGRVIGATHMRTIDSMTFSQWEQTVAKTRRAAA
jgi:hypothetical protein